MARKGRIVLGLNSGTSADGVDAAAVEIAGRGPGMRVRVLGHVARSYAVGLRRRILAAMAPAGTRTKEICRLDAEIGGAFAETAAQTVKSLGLKRVDFVGSHGQTVCHLPPRSGRRLGGRRTDDSNGATMQIGDPAIIAARLRVPVVSHFRQADMAVGGQGAPLVPWTDFVLFRDPKRGRLLQNIGGISNITFIPGGGGPERVVAFDIGPGNMVIDALVRHFTRGRESFDRGGRRAEAGTVDRLLLGAMVRHPFIAAAPPKSCGREEFGDAWLQGLLRRFAGRRIAPADWIATACWFFGYCSFMAYTRLRIGARSRARPFDEVILCGGGARNRQLVRWIETMATLCGDSPRPIAIKTTEDYGISIQAKECVSFAMLAAACVDRIPANLPQVTGASRRVVLGQICDSEPRR